MPGIIDPAVPVEVVLAQHPFLLEPDAVQQPARWAIELKGYASP